MTSYVSHNLPLPNSKTSISYLTPFTLARDVIYELSFGHNSEMWYTKYAVIYNYPHQATVTYNRLFIAIHNHPHMASS